ncbi:hypothetical protein WP50_38925, partial [Lactiplantibacillus plantarum]
GNFQRRAVTGATAMTASGDQLTITAHAVVVATGGYGGDREKVARTNFHFNTTFTDLVITNGAVTGATAMTASGDQLTITAHAVVVATGGYGGDREKVARTNFHFNTTFTDLVITNGAVTGATAMTASGDQLTITAHAVVVATGGYGGDREKVARTNFHFNTTFTDLVITNGAVTGATAMTASGDQLTITAHAVVVATGGYGGDREKVARTNFHFNTTFTDLVITNGAVTGATAMTASGDQLTITAHAVVVATGGYGGDREKVARTNFHFNTTFTDLVITNGAVTGATAMTASGDQLTITAHAVVVATGGYGGDREKVARTNFHFNTTFTDLVITNGAVTGATAMTDTGKNAANDHPAVA